MMDKEASQLARDGEDGVPPLEGQNPASNGTASGETSMLSHVHQAAIAELAMDLQRRQAEQGDDPQDHGWLAQAMEKHLADGAPDASDPTATEHRRQQARADALAVVTAVTRFQTQQESARIFQSEGGSIRAWFAEALGRAAQSHGANSTAEYTARVDHELSTATRNARACITRKDGGINQNEQLHGFIAEQHHTDTLNIDAATRDLDVRAHRPASTDRNSVDITLKENGETVGDYQAKWGKSSDHTERALEKGDYASQERLVPTEQMGQVEGSTDRVQHGGAESKPLSHEEAKQRQEDAQERGQSKEYDWDDVDLRTAGTQVGKQVLLAAALAVAVQAARIGARRGWKALRGEETPTLQEDWSEFCTKALGSAAQSGCTVALVGAVTVAVRKGWLGKAVQGLDANYIAIAACLAVENAKVLHRLSRDEITPAEAAGELSTVTFVALATIAGSYAGQALGSAVGGVFGPPGIAIGGFVGSLIGGGLSATAAEAICDVAPACVDYLVRQAKRIGSATRQWATEYMDDFAASLRGFMGVLPA